MLDYLDYSLKQEDIVHLSVWSPSITVFANRHDFQNLITFKKLFDDLYYIPETPTNGEISIH